ncbi:hypothetical protein OROMI_029238 [Orobanche minor]
MDSSSFSNPTSCVSASLPNTTAIKKEKSKNKKRRGGAAVKLSTDPQSIAARQRRHRISDRFKILQSLVVPGGLKLDTVSVLEETMRYVKFLKAQILLHQAMIGLVDINADIHDDDPAASVFPRNLICSAVPLQHQNVDLCNEYSGEQGETDLGWAVSWFSGAGNNS